MTWLARTPQAVVRAHVEMMEKLMAEEAQGQLAVAGVARALELGRWVQRQLSQWARSVGGITPAKTARPADLSAIGIGFREV